MHEGPPTVESQEKITREQVINMYKKFVEQGITNPGDLDLDNPEVMEANELAEKWMAQEDTGAAGNEDAEMRTNFEKTMLYIDAGFHDPNYLDEVLDWLMQDAQNTPKDKDNPARVQLRHDMAEAIVKLRNLA